MTPDTLVDFICLGTIGFVFCLIGFFLLFFIIWEFSEWRLNYRKDSHNHLKNFKCPDCGAGLKLDNGKVKFVKHNT